MIEKYNLQEKSQGMSHMDKLLLKEKKLEISWRLLEDSKESFESILSHLIQGGALMVNSMSVYYLICHERANAT